jgi:hypothetical protein
MKDGKNPETLVESSEGDDLVKEKERENNYNLSLCKQKLV